MTVYIPGLNETDLKNLIRSLQQLGAGRSNATGIVTLSTNAATTVVIPPQSGIIAPGSQPILTATTAAAAAELASGNMFVSNVSANSFSIAPTNSAAANRTFLYAILG
jgi:hypothetical protein